MYSGSLGLKAVGLPCLRAVSAQADVTLPGYESERWAGSLEFDRDQKKFESQ